MEYARIRAYSAWWSVSWHGLVTAAGFALYYQVAYFELPVVAAADGYQIVDVGVPAVAVPFLDVVEFAAVHGCPALETAPVPDSYG